MWTCAFFPSKGSRLGRMGCFLVWLLGIATSGNAAITDTVQLKGYLANFGDQPVIEDFSEFQHLIPPESKTDVSINVAGEFSVTLKVLSPNYFRLGRNVLYLSPGDNLVVSIDNNDPEKSTFEGIGATANRYLRQTPYPHAGSYLFAGKYLGTTPTETVATTKTEASKRKGALDAIRGSVSEEFAQLEDGRIRADTFNSLESAKGYAKYRLKGDELKSYLASYDKVVGPIKKEYAQNFLDENFLKLEVYRSISRDLLELNPGAGNGSGIVDWLNANAIAQKAQSENDKAKLSGYIDTITSIRSPAYKKALQDLVAQLSRFGKGDRARDFEATDLDGNRVSLTSLKGKVIYVDLWATWCGPCLEEMPAFEKLKASLAHNENVELVSLSIDDDVGDWKKNVESRGVAGHQWHASRADLHNYNIIGVPRSIVFDRSFVVVDMYGPLPSSEKLKDELVGLAASARRLTP